MTFRRWLPLLASLPVLAALLALGTWQVQRLQWKTALLDTITASEAGPAVPLGAAPSRSRGVSRCAPSVVPRTSIPSRASCAKSKRPVTRTLA